MEDVRKAVGRPKRVRAVVSDEKDSGSRKASKRASPTKSAQAGIVAARRQLSKLPLKEGILDLEQLEEQLYRQSLGVCDSLMRFAEVDPAGPQEPPQIWVDEMGQERAQMAHKIAQAGWMSQKDAPMALHVAPKLALGICAVRAKVQDDVSPVTVNIVNMPSAEHSYKKLELTNG
jgi:hypothetical protein